MGRRRWKYLGVLIYLFFVSPLLPGHYGKPAFYLLILASLWAISERSGTLRVGLALGLPALSLSLLSQEPGVGLGRLFSIIFLLFVTVIIQRDLAKDEDVTIDTLFGAVVGYLMLATSFAVLFALLEGFFPGSFSSGGSPILADFQTMLYFSIVTISTLGYGDITPSTQGAQSLAALEAVVGQFYFALMVARLLALYLNSSKESNSHA